MLAADFDAWVAANRSPDSLGAQLAKMPRPAKPEKEPRQRDQKRAVPKRGETRQRTGEKVDAVARYRERERRKSSQG